MLARLSAKAFLLTVGLALIFFGAGLIEWGLAAALKPYTGPAWGDVIAGATPLKTRVALPNKIKP